ncbi:MAG: ABC transporter ATP-binding protein, partial [Erysipelothrix sp.]|nr:ABC transporter ATP-binding protein [Erysipelothrix sp.]
MKKTSNLKKTIKNFLDYIGKYVPAIIVVLILSTIGTILQVLGPDKLKLMTDEIAKGLP